MKNLAKKHSILLIYIISNIIICLAVIKLKNKRYKDIDFFENEKKVQDLKIKQIENKNKQEDKKDEKSKTFNFNIDNKNVNFIINNMDEIDYTTNSKVIDLIELDILKKITNGLYFFKNYESFDDLKKSNEKYLDKEINYLSVPPEITSDELAEKLFKNDNYKLKIFFKKENKIIINYVIYKNINTDEEFFWSFKWLINDEKNVVLDDVFFGEISNDIY